MKKLVLAASLITAMTMTGCGNMDLVDTVFTYNKAVIKMADGSIVSGDVESWRDYEDGDQLQVTIDGTTYLVHAANITLICD